MSPPRFQAADFLADKGRTEHVLAHEVLMRGEHVRFVLDVAPKIAQHLHCALISDMGTRCIGQPSVAIDHHGLDAVGGQQSCGGGSRRACADNENVGRDVGHRALLSDVSS